MTEQKAHTLASALAGDAVRNDVKLGRRDDQS
jgi:hypothetical protein